MPHQHHRPLRTRKARPAAPLQYLLTLALALPLLSSCRTRLLETLDVDPPVDAALDAHDLALPDLTLPPDTCGIYTIVTTRVIRPSLLIVQDKSRSMLWGVDGDRNPPAGQAKWDLTREAIKKVINAPGSASVDWGLMLFGTVETCGAPTKPNVTVGPGKAAVISRVLDLTVIDAGTPTTQTLKNAVAWFKTVNDNQPHYMLLSTDGLPACAFGANGNPNADDSPAAILAVAAAAAAGIPTFVVGIGTKGDQQAEATLVSMAKAGGVPNTTPGQPAYYPVGSSDDLVNVLQKAVVRITPCSYPLEAAPPDPERVTIQGANGVIPRDLTHDNGWDYSDGGKNVSFYGPACEQLRSGVVTSVEAIYGCPGDLSM